MSEGKKEKLKNFGVPLPKGNERPGILVPLMQYRFRVFFLGETHTNGFTWFKLVQNVEFAHIDGVKKTIHISIRQDTDPEIFNLVNLVINNEADICVEPLGGGNDNAVFTLALHKAKCIKHDVKFDYSESDIVCHDLVFEFASMEATKSVKWKEHFEKVLFTEKDFFQDPECPSPQEALKRYEEQMKARAAKDSQS